MKKLDFYSMLTYMVQDFLPEEDDIFEKFKSFTPDSLDQCVYETDFAEVFKDTSKIPKWITEHPRYKERIAQGQDHAIAIEELENACTFTFDLVWFAELLGCNTLYDLYGFNCTDAIDNEQESYIDNLFEEGDLIAEEEEIYSTCLPGGYMYWVKKCVLTDGEELIICYNQGSQELYRKGPN